MSVPSWARIGAKVVCIKKGEWAPSNGAPREFHNTCPVYGGVYTIRSVVRLPSGTGLRFEEIHNPVYPYADGASEKSFLAFRFRPLVSRTQEEDIELFRSLLTDLPVEVDA